MGFPTVTSFARGVVTGTGLPSDHALSIPSGSGGLLLMIAAQGASMSAWTWPAGWTLLATATIGTSTDGVVAAYYRVADGTEGATMNVQTPTLTTIVYHAYRLGSYSGVPVAGTFGNVGSGHTTPDPPNLTSGFGAVDTLWLAVAGWANDTVTVSAYPASYTDGSQDHYVSGSTSGGSIATARRALNAASENPGVFTFTGGAWNQAFTIAIKGGAPVPTGSDIFEIIPPGDSLSFVGTLDDAYNKSIRPVRNEPGSGMFTISRHSAHATAAILKPGNLVKVCYPLIDPGYIFAWFMETGLDRLVSTDEEGGEDVTIGGRGALSYWDRAIWLSEKFVIPWWDAGWGSPPAGALGHVTFVAGTYRRYTIAGGVITGYTNFTTAGFEAYYDTRQTYQWPSENSQRFLVHIMTGETNAGWYVHPGQDGVTHTRSSQTVGTSTSVLLSDISADTPGAILYRLFQEGQDPARPYQPIPLMTVDFSATLDSNGAAWATTDALAGLTAELGETYLDTIVKLLSTGVIDVEMGPDLDMHAYNSRGRTLTSPTFATGKVRFVKGVNIADELRRERDSNPVATFIEVVGTDNAIGRAVLPDAATRVARETTGRGDSADTTVLAAIGLALLNARLIKSDAIGFAIATGNDDATGLYLPGPAGTTNGDFWLGDLVTLHTGTGELDFNQAAERVYAITIGEDDAGNLAVMPEVGSVLGEAERALYAGIKGTSTSFTSRSQFSDTAVAETPPVIAAAVSIADAGALFTAADVEAALQELAKKDIGYTAHGNTGATETFDALTGWHSATLNAATVTATFTGATSGLLAGMVLELAQDGTGGRLVTWPGSVVWAGGVAPTLSSAAAAVDILTFFSRDGGTTWYGFPTGGSGGSALTIKDEGSSLATAATSIDFVGAGVTASGTGAAKTVTIPGGAPTEAQVRDAGRWEVLMTDGITSPPEPIWNEAGTDWLLGWITGP